MGRNSGTVTTIKDGRAFIEEVARCKGTFSDAFRRRAEEEAANGHKELLQMIEGGEENRKDLAKALEM